MVIYLYRWKLKLGEEENFSKAWEVITQNLKEKCGSLGSRLHRGNDGLFYGYAQWPSVEIRENAKLQSEEMKFAREQMQNAISETFPPVILNPVKDYL